MSRIDLSTLPDKDRTPTTIAALNAWVNHAAKALGIGDSGRLSWQIASTIVVAAMQRVSDPELGALFLLKGGAFLERRLSATSRSTKDVDAMFRGEVDAFVQKLDEAFAEPWGPFTLSRSEIETINVPVRRVKPRRFAVRLEIRGRVWRKIQVEIAFADGATQPDVEYVPADDFGFFGLESANELVTISLAYQVAQKLHACTDPHDPPTRRNDSVRDVLDLLLIKEQLLLEGVTLVEVRSAAETVFAGRAAEAESLGLEGRTWPPVIISNEIWVADYPRAASQAEVTLTLDEAIKVVNAWIEEIAAAA
ncbi:nucleotidyl transferase AbiEii/AbiGii toxin family protein [Leifsonia sp. McL0607]|uniref:nucleotidyl transferase AbiEii/AbiGii toxin family protein n=1 Tax=Leifsonia sp. McL0607 TaxID=3415672 RepID=UPI003CF55456